MAKTATKPAPAAKPATNAATKTAQAAAQSDAAAEKAMNTGEGKPDPKPREGKAPNGKTWVQWFKDEHAKGRSAEELQKEYVELRTPEYEGKIDVLKRHAYRHRKLALPNSGPNVKEEVAAE